MFIIIVTTNSCLEGLRAGQPSQFCGLLSLLLPDLLGRHTLPQPQIKIISSMRQEPMLTVLVEPLFSACLLIYLFRPTKPVVWQNFFFVKNNFMITVSWQSKALKNAIMTLLCHSGNGNQISERVWSRVFFFSLKCKSLLLKKIQQNNKS